LAGQLSVGFGRFLAVGGAMEGGEHVSATTKAVREAGYRLGSERGSPNHGSMLASKWVMAGCCRRCSQTGSSRGVGTSDSH
jgi:hypothetical protein